jgi:metacaspase-1
MKKALLIGLNDYLGEANDLKGCLNDIDLVGKKLEGFGYTVHKIINEQAKVRTVKNELLAFLKNSAAGDQLVFWYSGHGTQCPDYNKDENDKYDEALYLYDGVLVDDDIQKILIQKPAGVKLFIGMDCCFSGTNTREIDSYQRYKPFLNGRKMDINGNLKGRKRRRAIIRQPGMDYVVLTGCADAQTSADALIMGKYHGAMTYFAMRNLKAGLTYAEWYRDIRKHLPNAYFDQIPQLEGAAELLNDRVFGTEKKCWFKIFKH